MSARANEDARAEPDGGASEDGFLDGRLRLYQPEDGFRAGLDAMLLGASVPAGTAKAAAIEVLDLGAGTGGVGLSVAVRNPDAEVTLVERERALTALLRRSIARNRLGRRVRVVEIDLLLAEAGGETLRPESFDVVLANPPFDPAGQGRQPKDPTKARSRVAGKGELPGWIAFALRHLKPGGAFHLIHRADGLGAVLTGLGARWGGIVVLPIAPFEGLPAKRIIVRAVKGSRTPLKLLAPFIVHDPDGAFTAAADAILRGNSSLDLGVR